MADLLRIKNNVAKMAAQNAPEEDIDGYIASEGVSIDDVRNFKSSVSPERTSVRGLLWSGFNQKDPYNIFEQQKIGILPDVKRGLFSALSSMTPGGEITLKKPVLAGDVAGAVDLGMAIPKVVRGVGTLSRRIAPKSIQDVAASGGDVLGELKTAKKAFGEGIGDIINQSPDEMLDSAKIMETLKSLPKNTIKSISDKKYQIKWLKNGVPQPTLKNIQNLKEAIGDQMTNADWIKTPADKEIFRNAYGKIKDIMVSSKKELGPQLEAYHKFYNDIYDPLISRISKKGQPRINSMLQIMSSSGEPTEQAALEAIKEISPGIKEPLSALKAFGVKREFKRIPTRLPFIGGVFK